MSVNKETKSSAEIINDLHTKLKKDGIILKGIRSDLLKLIKKYDDAYDLPILVSAIKDAADNIERAIYNLEEEINS
jgi:hypothetical protein